MISSEDEHTGKSDEMVTEMETVIVFYSCSLVTKFVIPCMQMGALGKCISLEELW